MVLQELASTLARQLAERNQLLYVNTGSMFRWLGSGTI